MPKINSRSWVIDVYCFIVHDKKCQIQLHNIICEEFQHSHVFQEGSGWKLVFTLVERISLPVVKENANLHFPLQWQKSFASFCEPMRIFSLLLAKCVRRWNNIEFRIILRIREVADVQTNLDLQLLCSECNLPNDQTQRVKSPLKSNSIAFFEATKSPIKIHSRNL